MDSFVKTLMDELKIEYAKRVKRIPDCNVVHFKFNRVIRKQCKHYSKNKSKFVRHVCGGNRVCTFAACPIAGFDSLSNPDVMRSLHKGTDRKGFG